MNHLYDLSVSDEINAETNSQTSDFAAVPLNNPVVDLQGTFLGTIVRSNAVLDPHGST